MSWHTADSLFSSSGIMAYAEGITQTTNASVQNLLRGFDGSWSTINITFGPELPDAPQLLTDHEPPQLLDVVWEVPAAPTAFTGTLDIGDFMPEPFDDDPPTMVFGSAPDAFVAPLPDAPGVDVNFTYPDDISIQLPSAPDLLSINVQPFSGVTIPEVDFEVPELTIVAPSIREYTPGAGYSSALLTELQSTLLDRIQNGGTGLNAAVEQALWDRGREREARAAGDAVQALDAMEVSGFALPPGVYLDARLKIQTEMAASNVGLSREIMIKQAELELENVRHALELAISLEGRLMEQNNAVEQRLFEAARYATEAGVAIYNARVQAYAAFLDAYRAKVAIYEAQVRAELAKVEVFKAQVDTELAKAQINTAKVEAFKAQAEVALADVEIYKAQIAAIQSKAEVEKIKIQIFGEQIRGYTARVGAYTAGVEGFKAQVGAETAKQDAYRAQVQAYGARVDAGAKVIDARLAEFTGHLRAKEVEWDAYRASAQAQAARAQATNATNTSLLGAYTAEQTTMATYNDTMTKRWQAQLEQAARAAEIAVAAAKVEGDLSMTARSLAQDAAKTSAMVAAQLGAAALNQINLSTSQSRSVGYSTSWNNSDSKSDSHSVNYNYNASI